ncbi:LAETG motif-containing sortase-dependent surface protein [Streptomyces sp. NPDC002328]|uniref:LAETG motif-containing sortase-dependent surface protein n=1 Tax=Streptomyces sp. NPDC002328 TaxID=3364642 RepID=UPI003695F025
MKLRRAMVTMAATAVIAPLALLSAPVAFAEDGASPSASASESSSASASASASDTTSPSASESSTSSPSGSASASASGSASGSPSASASDSSGGKPTPSTSTPADEDIFDPAEDCESLDLDENLSANIKGLPNKIVAGSGWHDFEYVVENNSSKDLKNVYMEAGLEYGDDTDVFLTEGLAVVQVKEDGKWTDAYQESYEDEDGKTVNLTGTFVGLLDVLEKDSSASLDLRVKIKASAPAGSAFALSAAFYAGENSSCYFNGDLYDVEILAAGSKPGDVDDAEPNGNKPTGTEGTKTQGGAKPISGSLAETGSDSALPMIALVGGVTVVAGVGVVFAVRRRKTTVA